MLLRRVIAHFRKQEWTAIAIDFVIVVLGVFVGIQVSNWNAARADRAEERHLLTRLHDETRALLDFQKIEYAEQAPRLEAMTAVHPLLFGPAPERTLTDADCRLIAISHWLPAPTDELPIFAEATSTGRIDLISSESVKTNLRSFAIVRDRSRRQYAEAINELFRLNARHPHAIWYVRAPTGDLDDPVQWARRDPVQWARRAGDGYKWGNQCDLEKMRGDKAFLAEYVDNVLRLSSFVDRYEGLIAVLEDLEMALAAELGQPASSGPEGDR